MPRSSSLLIGESSSDTAAYQPQQSSVSSIRSSVGTQSRDVAGLDDPEHPDSDSVGPLDIECPEHPAGAQEAMLTLASAGTCCGFDVLLRLGESGRTPMQ